MELCVRDDSARRLVANWRAEGQVGLRSGKNCWHSCSIATRKSLRLFFFMSIYFDPTKNRQKARKFTKNQNTLLGKRIWDSNSNKFKRHFRVPFNILCGSLVRNTVSKGNNRAAQCSPGRPPPAVCRRPKSEGPRRERRASGARACRSQSRGTSGATGMCARSEHGVPVRGPET